MLIWLGHSLPRVIPISTRLILPAAILPRLNFAKDNTSVSSTVVWQADAETGIKSGQGQGNNQTTIGTGTALTLVATNTNVTIAKGRYQGAITGP